jgi:hypothetical protein
LVEEPQLISQNSPRFIFLPRISYEMARCGPYLGFSRFGLDFQVWSGIRPLQHYIAKMIITRTCQVLDEEPQLISQNSPRFIFLPRIAYEMAARRLFLDYPRFGLVVDLYNTV